MKAIRHLALLLLSLGFLTAAFAADDKPRADKSKTTKYPLTTCIVTDNDLESMGGSITKVYDGQEVKFCCKPCIKKFERNKDRYLAKLKGDAPKPVPAAEHPKH